jgi:hypothetical protein
MELPTVELARLHATPLEEVEFLQKLIIGLLEKHGAAARCKGCGQAIYWIIHKSGRKAPYNTEGLNHFSDCEKRELFRKERLG